MRKNKGKELRYANWEGTKKEHIKLLKVAHLVHFIFQMGPHFALSDKISGVSTALIWTLIYGRLSADDTPKIYAGRPRSIGAKTLFCSINYKELNKSLWVIAPSGLPTKTEEFHYWKKNLVILT